jgi:hypothetical protein
MTRILKSPAVPGAILVVCAMLFFPPVEVAASMKAYEEETGKELGLASGIVHYWNSRDAPLLGPPLPEAERCTYHSAMRSPFDGKWICVDQDDVLSDGMPEFHCGPRLCPEDQQEFLLETYTRLQRSELLSPTTGWERQYECPDMGVSVSPDGMAWPARRTKHIDLRGKSWLTFFGPYKFSEGQKLFLCNCRLCLPGELAFARQMIEALSDSLKQ